MLSASTIHKSVFNKPLFCFQPQEILAAVDEALETFGKIDFVINSEYIFGIHV